MAGAKEGGVLVRKGEDGRDHRIPYGRIVGVEPGEKVTVYGGQHGTEYDGLEAVQRLFRETQPEAVRGELMIALATNEQSFLNWEQFSPTPPAVAAMMRELAEGSTALINCHGGEFSEGMNPYVICRLIGEEATDAKARRMADAFGVRFVSFSQYRGEPPDTGGVRPAWWLWPKRSMADELRIAEITPEVGERGSRDEKEIMHGGVVNVLRTLGVLAGEPAAHPAPRSIGERYWLTAEKDGVFFPTTCIDADVEEGEALGVVRDYWGATLQTVRAPAAAKVMNMNWGMPVKRDGFLLWLGVIEE